MALIDISRISDNDISRFWAKVKIASCDQCWEWSSAISTAGRPVFTLQGHTVLASHVALTFSGSPRTDDLHALHSCDNDSCVNPRHLWWGTNKDNVDDMMAKGRNSRGSKHTGSKLTEESVIEIRSIRGRRNELAAKFGVSASAIGRLRARRTWRHLP